MLQQFTNSPIKKRLSNSQAHQGSAEYLPYKSSLGPTYPITTNYVPFENKQLKTSPGKVRYSPSKINGPSQSSPFLSSSMNSQNSFNLQQQSFSNELNGGDENTLVSIINKEYKYYGQTRKTVKYGIGTLSDLNNNIIYQGQWINDKYEGKGTLNNLQQHKDWVKYIGEFKNGLKQGAGIEYYKDGSYFVGNFIENIKSGIGNLYMKDTNIIGLWKKGILMEKY